MVRGILPKTAIYFGAAFSGKSKRTETSAENGFCPCVQRIAQRPLRFLPLAFCNNRRQTRAVGSERFFSIAPDGR